MKAKIRLADASYYRARYYDPTTGRFLSEDFIRFDSQGPNLYLYVGSHFFNTFT